MARLTNLHVEYLSLVKNPATGKGVTLKSIDGQAVDDANLRVAGFALVKADDELRRAYGIVYAPDQEDAHGDTASAETIRKAQADFMRQGRLWNIDTEHSFNNEMAFVAESWLVRKGDALFPQEPEGAWAVGIQIGDTDLWAQLKSGALTGISLAGFARAEPEGDDITPSAVYAPKSKARAVDWAMRLIKPIITTDPQNTIKETDMDKEGVQDIVRATLDSELGPAIQKAMQAASKTDTADPAPKAEEDLDLKAKSGEPGNQNGVTAGDLAALEKRLGDKIERALAKGATETGLEAGHSNEVTFV